MQKTDRSVQIESRNKHQWWTLLILLFAPLMSVVDIFIVNVSLPTIQSYYHTTNANIQLVVVAYLVGYAVFLITGSRTGDKLGRKKIFCLGMLLFTLTSALCGLAGSIEQLIVFRFLQGVGAAFMVPQTVTLIHLTFKEGRDRDKAFGYFGIIQGFAAVLGQFLGGYFIHAAWIKAPWRLIFLVNIPIGLVAAILAAIFLKESVQNKQKRMDIGGVGLLTLALVFLIYPITQGRELGWPQWSLAMLSGGFVLLYAFILNQKKKERSNREPLIHLDIFQIKSFRMGVLCVFFYFGLHNAFLLCSAVLLQKGYNLPPYSASLLFTCIGWAFVISSYLSIRQKGRYGERMLQAGCVMMLISFAAQALFFTQHTPSQLIIISCFVVYGLGSGFVLPSILNVTLQQVPAKFAGSSSGIYSTIQQFSSAAGVSIVAGIFFALLSRSGNYLLSYRVTLFCMILYLVIIILLLDKMRKAKTQMKNMDLKNATIMKQQITVLNGSETKIESPALQTVSLFYKAFNSKDLLLMQQVWLNELAASMDNPIGGIRRGWEDIRMGYEKLFQGKLHIQVEFYDFTLHTTEEMFVVVGRERGTLTYNEKVLELAIRTSRTFIKQDSAWKQLHHHGSIDSPALLEQYQGIILGKTKL